MQIPYTTRASTQTLLPGGQTDFTETRLSGRWLVAARVIWITIATLTLIVFLSGMVAALAHIEAVCPTPACAPAQITPVLRRALNGAGYSYGFFIAFSVLLSILFAVPYAGVALLIFWRRSDDGMALLTSIALLTFGLATYTPMAGALVSTVPATGLLVSSLVFFGSISFFGFLYLFPTGRFAPRWVIGIALAYTVQQMFHIFFSGTAADASTWPLAPQLLIWTVFLGSTIYAQIYRYRRVSNRVQRQQTKWVVYGIATALICYIAVQALLIAIIRDVSKLTPDDLRASLVGTVIIYAAMTLIPLSIGIAMTRYHLFDVDVLINRTLVYGALTLSVIVLYVLIVGGFSVAFQVSGNPIVSLVATGVVAVVVQPLRQRLQRAVNRLIYGQRDEPYAVLSELGQRLEATLAPEAVLPTIVETVTKALRLPYAAVALNQDDGFISAASYGTLVGEPLMMPLVYQTEMVGKLMLGPRVPGEGWTRGDLQLLDDLTHQAGIAAHAVQLHTELRHARERLVLAREEARRRLRRDLHDGLGPQLASQVLTLTAAIKLLRQDPDAAEGLLTEAMTNAQAAIADIRRVVYELRPAALDDLGLIGALQEQAAHYHASGVQIVIAAPESLPPLPAAVEVACFRIAQEALTNVIRHAHARHCTIALAVDDRLRLEIRDDGTGIPADRKPGVGLSSMRERAEEVGGTCMISPMLENGTRVFVRLPLT